MSDTMKRSATRVAILAASEKIQQRLSSLLTDAGLNVVAQELPGDGFLAQLENASPDVLLVDLSEESGSETDIIDTLLDYDALPIFFNDSSPAGDGANVRWAKKIARKLSDIVTQHDPVVESASKPEITPGPLLVDAAVTIKDAADVITPDIETVIDTLATLDMPPAEKPEGAAVNIWVLGASLGGPQAVRQFLATVEENLPVAFILAQHIGANHIALLAEQLNRVTSFVVLAGQTGHLLRHKEVILTPADRDIEITEDGYLSLKPAMDNAIYSPSIDNVMSAVASRYGDMAGTIVFSGMGDDGARGCETMAQHGGIVWAQDVDSCVISSMPDQARKTGTVTFSANPQALAERLHQYYRD